MSSLDRLLRPTSIAVVGGGAWCENVLQQCEKIGFSGDIWPVHPHKTEILGRPVFSSLMNLPAAPDATFIGVNRTATIDVVQTLSDMGAGGAICFASGYQEAQKESRDGADLQDQLVEAAGEMKIIGPNCYGLVNYLDGVALWPDQHGGTRNETGVAIITQSSNIAINLTMQNRGLPIAYVVTAGNQAQTGLSEIGMAVLEDPRVTALGLHIEGIDDLRQFEVLAEHAQALKKSIIALKIGASDQARTATISHTASLAGSDAGATALMKRLGIGQVRSLAAFLETLKILHVNGPLRSGQIASMSCSGGEASLFADTAEGSSVSFPPLNQTQLLELRGALGPMVALANPLDYHTYIWGDVGAMAETFSAMMDPGLGLGCIVVDFPRSDRCNAQEWDLVIEAALTAKRNRGVPMALVASLPENMPEPIAVKIMGLGLIALCGLDTAVQAIEIASNLTMRSSDPVLHPRVTKEEITLNECEAKKRLSVFGVETPETRQVDTLHNVAAVANELTFPVALKGEGIAHKSEAGAVVLNLADGQSVETAAKNMNAKSFLIEEMVSGSVCEVLVGVVCDPAHGYVLTVAAGGVLTEVLQDQANVLIPASRSDIEKVVMSLRVAPVLKGFRGKPAANIPAIVDAIMALQDFVIATPVTEAEINPLICTQDKAIACDALIKIGTIR